jgi:hypothetical protein
MSLVRSPKQPVCCLVGVLEDEDGVELPAPGSDLATNCTTPIAPYTLRCMVGEGGASWRSRCRGPGRTFSRAERAECGVGGACHHPRSPPGCTHASSAWRLRSDRSAGFCSSAGAAGVLPRATATPRFYTGGDAVGAGVCALTVLQAAGGVHPGGGWVSLTETSAAVRLRPVEG